VDQDYIALATPFFALLIAVELVATRMQHRAYYRLSDTINNISTGILQQLGTLLGAGVLIGGYVFLYSHARLFEHDAAGVMTWLGCFLAIDFAYYWFHRLSHEVNFMWAAHVVHHQSEDYNLGVALRQSSLQPFISMVFYWPLAVIGFPPAVFAVCASLNTIYQFWIHTRLIGQLGWLESVLMTPSHHRVHHGRNPIYIDRNHGATFIVWDKLFGTYQREEEEVAYGITTPLGSWNPIWANFQYWAELWHSARKTHRLSDKVAVFLKPPGWFPDDLGGFRAPPEIERPFVRFDTPCSPRMGAYAIFQFVQLLALLMALLILGTDAGAAATLGCAALIAWGLTAIGGLLENHEWAQRAEWVRVIATSLAWLVVAPALVAPMIIALNFVAAHLAGIRWRRALASDHV